jgi:hypothetical protein
VLGTGSSGNMGNLALVPASYMSYQLTDDLVAGLSLNSPFGLGNKTDFAWVGQTFNRKSQVKTYNGQLALAYKRFARHHHRWRRHHGIHDRGPAVGGPVSRPPVPVLWCRVTISASVSVVVLFGARWTAHTLALVSALP